VCDLCVVIIRDWDGVMDLSTATVELEFVLCVTLI
jgi:hypothetical protein